MIQAVIFDMDGTMLDTEALYQQSFRETAPQYGREWTREIGEKTTGLNLEDWVSRLQSIWGENFPAAEFRRKSDELRHQWMQTTGIPKKPGLMELLQQLRAWGIPMAVASSTGAEEARKELETAGLSSYFFAGVFGDMVSRGKPDPEIYQKAAEALGFASQQCMAVEDSFNGVRAAAAAGCFTVMVPDQKQPTQELLRQIQAKKETLHGIIPLMEQLREVQ